MITEFEKIKKIRLFLLALTEELTIEQLNEIPEGFNNNIIWNLTHLISAQQGLCYVRSGHTIVIEDKYFSPYRSGTKPEKYVDLREVEEIKELLISTIDKLESDYQRHIFSTYDACTLRYGIAVSNIDDAIGFLLFHEGLHHGYIMALKRIVKNKS